MEKQPHSRLYRGDLEECRLEYSESPSTPCRRSSDDPRAFLCRLPNWSLQATMRSSRRLISSSSSQSPTTDIVAVTSALVGGFLVTSSHLKMHSHQAATDSERACAEMIGDG